MTIALINVAIRHSRRIRLVFSTSLAAGAFSALSHYSVTNQDGRGASPNVVAAFVLPGSPAAVELALDADLVAGAIYQVEADGVPALDSSVTPTPSVETINIAQPNAQPNVEIHADDIDALVFGVDLVHDGVDYVEGSDGDLATIAGEPNVVAAILRREVSDGLPWDPSYGAKPRQYVDGAFGALTQLRGALVRQAVADDRVKQCDVTLTQDPNDPSQAFFEVTPTLITGSKPPPIQVPTP